MPPFFGLCGSPHKPKAMSSLPSSVRNQVHWASGVKSLSTGVEVDVGVARVHADDLCLAVGDQLFVLGFGEESHWSVPSVSGPQRSGHNGSRTAVVRGGTD